ncbi:biotin--[acetyl-CoA-carboxylase] ligase [Oleiagrimonas sp. C23AA]|uniref:biotin--[acetyl-CoA-carboxylase] ligase n=1 Tax=Oleiagrimonas sp. C23AA TaxID=2719047 RepID=UPI001422A1B2|nr:biotin--[acetyl-CoA-carboxylase] ligase [Oleiagrimonas sp. C23AA]NII11876.1 biotin--[acetyl-CoA-carboxylase] ligase [Oleiagrimonas sp. C23AA]
MHPRDLLEALAEGQAHSGAALADHLHVTRAAVWKQIEALRQRGLPVDAQAGAGYRLPWPVQLLDQHALRERLADLSLGALEVHWELDSTSSELQRRDDVADLSFVLAEMQSAGRGRRGRHWLSPPALNIYVSCLKRFDLGFAQLSGLSLAVGVALMRTLSALGIAGVGLKWPNDVLAGPAKLAGVLVELSGEFQGPCEAVIGIGLNVRLPEALRAQAGQPVTDLATLCGGQAPDRNQVAATLIRTLAETLRQFEREGFAAFIDAYNAADVLRGRELTLSGPQHQFHGTGAGVDARGALRVLTADGELAVDSGEVSVRMA